MNRNSSINCSCQYLKYRLKVVDLDQVVRTDFDLVSWQHIWEAQWVVSDCEIARFMTNLGSIMKLDFTYNVELDCAHLLAFDFSDAGVKLSRRR